jgi:hypothetical protein
LISLVTERPSDEHAMTLSHYTLEVRTLTCASVRQYTLSKALQEVPHRPSGATVAKGECGPRRHGLAHFVDDE